MPTAANAAVRRVHRGFDVATAVVFGAALLAPAVDHLVRSDEARGPAPERRAPAPRPPMPHSFADAFAWPARYEAYWQDSFGLRDVLLRWHSIAMVFGFGVAPGPTHVLGKDGWIFNDNAQILDNWRGAIPLSPQQLELWRARLTRRRDAVRDLGAHYLFAIAPDKPHVYPEFVPDRFNVIGPSRMDQFFAYLGPRSDVDVLDLRPALRAARQGDATAGPTYFALGTHWTSRGANAAFDAMVVHLQPIVPSLRRLPLRDRVVRELAATADSEASNMYIGDLMHAQNVAFDLPQPRHRRLLGATPVRQSFATEDAGLPRVVMFHDSFGQGFDREWAETSSRLTMVSANAFDLDLIASEQPDLVVEVFVDRCLVIHDPAELTPSEQATGRRSERRWLAAREQLATIDNANASLRADQFFALAPLVPAGEQAIVARIELDAPRASDLALCWRRAGEVDWPTAQRAVTAVRPGHNVVFLEVPPSTVPQQLALQPGDSECRLRSIALRRAPAPAR